MTRTLEGGMQDGRAREYRENVKGGGAVGFQQHEKENGAAFDANSSMTSLQQKGLKIPLKSTLFRLN